MSIETGYQPPAHSLAFRANLARLVSPLRRVRPRVPFFELGAHRIPTLWGLYRGLLRMAPSEDIKFRMRMHFREHQHLTATGPTKVQLLKGYKYLDIFTKAHHGDAHLQRVLARYSRLIATKRKKAYYDQLAQEAIDWRHKLLHRPILTGGFLRPSIDNGPLPRMKPQPLAVSMMIRARRRARQKRIEKLRALEETLNDLRIEREFEEGLRGQFELEGVFAGKPWEEWTAPIRHTQSAIHQTFTRDAQRAALPYPPSLLAQIKLARRTKILNKTHELSRERRGEILPRTLKRMRQGPPAHILARMTPEQRVMDRIRRSVSEVGYVGMVKRRLGVRMRDAEGWKAEEGAEGERERLEREVGELREEMRRRAVVVGVEVGEKTVEVRRSQKNTGKKKKSRSKLR